MEEIKQIRLIILKKTLKQFEKYREEKTFLFGICYQLQKGMIFFNLADNDNANQLIKTFFKLTNYSKYSTLKNPLGIPASLGYWFPLTIEGNNQRIELLKIMIKDIENEKENI